MFEKNSKNNIHYSISWLLPLSFLMPFTFTVSANEIAQDGGLFGEMRAMQGTETLGKLIECITPSHILLIGPSSFRELCDESFFSLKKRNTYRPRPSLMLR